MTITAMDSFFVGVPLGYFTPKADMGIKRRQLLSNLLSASTLISIDHGCSCLATSAEFTRKACSALSDVNFLSRRLERKLSENSYFSIARSGRGYMFADVADPVEGWSGSGYSIPLYENTVECDPESVLRNEISSLMSTAEFSIGELSRRYTLKWKKKELKRLLRVAEFIIRTWYLSLARMKRDFDGLKATGFLEVQDGQWRVTPQGR